MIRTRKRFQRGSLKKVGKQWVAQWWENGSRRKARWLVSELNKSQAEQRLAAILAPINDASPARTVGPPTFGEFVEQTYLPHYRGKWKKSTTRDNEGRLAFHLTSVYASRRVDSFSREELQSLLKDKAAGYSYSVVAHIRWTLRQVFRMVMNDGHIDRNPAEDLFIPREAKRPERKVMMKEEVKQLRNALAPRERLIAELAIIAGMRPGEILALTWGSLTGACLDITQRLYRGELDTPKSHRGTREAALSDGLIEAVEQWRGISPCTAPSAWVFPSERLRTPVTRDNVWNRHFLPKLKTVGLEWATFQVMRRTNSTLMKKEKIDPKVGADQRGHGIGVSLDVYTQSDHEQKRAAVNALEAALA